MLYCHALTAGSVWHQEITAPFDELLLTWNGARPSQGYYRFFIRVQTAEWSPWIVYADWGRDFQSTFENYFHEWGIDQSQDTLSITEGKGKAFEIKLEALQGALETSSFVLSVCATKKDEIRLGSFNSSASIFLPLTGVSQFDIRHAEGHRLCSPSSIATVISYLRGSPCDVASFSSHVYDTQSKIYGNWVLNCSQGNVEMGKNWKCWAERLSNFDELFQFLKKGIPVVVSVKGPLIHSALPYERGHLMVVIGYEGQKLEVICMDPAFSKHAETIVRYPIQDFLAAWHRRLNLAYLFQKQ